MIVFRPAWLTLCALLAVAPASAAPSGSDRAEELLGRMTLEEKAGQLNMISALPEDDPKAAEVRDEIAAGRVGSLFNVHGADAARAAQEAAGRSRLGVPLLLAFDAIHGYRTIFPTPLGQAASWDMELIRRAERVTATEAAADGVNVIFAPMLDVTRDARWGRAVEGPGESPWLAARIAEARVKGLEGDDLAAPDATAACAKHLGANGAVEGGRDYTAPDLSRRGLRETYLPPFHAAVEAGAHCMMAAFNAPDGLPTVANAWLLTDVLRREWGFDGPALSDFSAVRELVVHGFARDAEDAAAQAFAAGADVDMQSKAFVRSLPDLVRAGVVPENALDAAVRRVLRLKEALGLFDDPSRGARPGRAEATLFRPEHRAVAQELAEKSAVLLKNEGGALPFRRDVRKVALIGPIGDSPADTLGPWAGRGEPSETVTLRQGLAQVLGDAVQLSFAAGGAAEASSDADIAAAVEAAHGADAVVLALGERFNQSGEGASRASLDLPGDQAKLARAVLALGKPAVAVVFAGRPLVLTELAAQAPAILYAWQPGSMGGLALARLIMGEVSPTGRLPMTFPRTVGQVPIHHEQRPTGRPATLPPEPYTAGYGDESHEPLYPFGFGLGYTSFSFGAPRLDRDVLRDGETVTAQVEVTNTGARAGETVAQLYLRPRVARLAPPLRQLRGHQRVALAPGESRTVTFSIRAEDFAYWLSDDRFAATAGPVEVMTGPDAADVRTGVFDYRPLRDAELSSGGTRPSPAGSPPDR